MTRRKFRYGSPPKRRPVIAVYSYGEVKVSYSHDNNCYWDEAGNWHQTPHKWRELPETPPPKRLGRLAIGNYNDPEELRANIIRLKTEGKNWREISQITGVSPVHATKLFGRLDDNGFQAIIANAMTPEELRIKQRDDT